MSEYVAKNFKFKNKGLGKILGTLEKDIMDVLWAKDGATGKEVLQELKKSRDIAITTVLTVLERLTRKGLVRRTKGEVYVYKPVYTKDDLAKTVSHEVIKGVLDLWSGPAMASFVNILAKRDPHELDRLSELITRKKSEMKRGR